MKLEPILAWEDLRQGDVVKVRVGNERLWFRVLGRSEVSGESPANSVICRLDSHPSDPGIVFDGRVTIDREWVIDAQRPVKTDLRLVG